MLFGLLWWFQPWIFWFYYSFLRSKFLIARLCILTVLIPSEKIFHTFDRRYLLFPKLAILHLTKDVSKVFLIWNLILSISFPSINSRVLKLYTLISQEFLISLLNCELCSGEKEKIKFSNQIKQRLRFPKSIMAIKWSRKRPSGIWNIFSKIVIIRFLSQINWLTGRASQNRPFNTKLYKYIKIYHCRFYPILNGIAENEWY
jgi:hypothetical protein